MSKLLTLALIFSFTACQAVAAEPQSFSNPQELSKLAGWKGAAVNSGEAFTFVILSDRNGGNLPGEWPAAVRQVNLLRPDFIMTVGDFIGGYSEDRAEIIRQWEEFEDETVRLAAPFFYTPGNHDITNPMMREVYIERHGFDGRTWYSFDYRGCHFVVLDSTAFEVPAQMDWLKQDMAGAGEAKHVFVFYHHPQWDTPSVWSRLASLLPEGKTTIFNGHWHSAGYKTIDGIATYVLPATAAETDESEVRLFVQVTVDEGKPSVALVPMNTVLPLTFLEAFGKLDGMLASVRPALISPAGGEYAISATNPLDEPATLKVSWQAKGWTITPESAELTLEPGQKVDQAFTLKPGAKLEGWPKVTATAQFRSATFERTIEKKRSEPLGAQMAMKGAMNKSITVDGDMKDWEGVEPLVLGSADRIFFKPENWAGTSDSSCSYRAATDGQTLFVSVQVEDNNILVDDAPSWFSDGVEFFWDVRNEAARKPERGSGTGQVILCVPAEDGTPRMEWFMTGQAKPEHFQAVCKRKGSGYIVELSAPLSELGLQGPVKAGQVIHLGLLLNDRDKAEGEPAVSRMSASGMGNEGATTLGYARCVFGE